MVVLSLMTCSFYDCSDMSDPRKTLLDSKGNVDPVKLLVLKRDPKRSGHRSLCDRNRRTRCHKLTMNGLTRTICFRQFVRCFSTD